MMAAGFPFQKIRYSSPRSWPAYSDCRLPTETADCRLPTVDCASVIRWTWLFDETQPERRMRVPRRARPCVPRWRAGSSLDSPPRESRPAAAAKPRGEVRVPFRPGELLTYDVSYSTYRHGRHGHDARAGEATLLQFGRVLRRRRSAPHAADVEACTPSITRPTC